jgi:hypothetical protein
VPERWALVVCRLAVWAMCLAGWPPGRSGAVQVQLSPPCVMPQAEPRKEGWIVDASPWTLASGAAVRTLDGWRR